MATPKILKSETALEAFLADKYGYPRVILAGMIAYSDSVLVLSCQPLSLRVRIGHPPVLHNPTPPAPFAAKKGAMLEGGGVVQITDAISGPYPVGMRAWGEGGRDEGRAWENPLVAVQQLGQSIWYDNIHRSLITSGDLQAMVDHDGLLGMTSNPAIFEKALTGSADYDQPMQGPGRTGGWGRP